jgi:hypothetical protein
VRVDGEGAHISLDYFLPALTTVAGPVTAIESHRGKYHFRFVATAHQMFEGLALKKLSDFGNRRPWGRPLGAHDFQAVIESDVVSKCPGHGSPPVSLYSNRTPFVGEETFLKRTTDRRLNRRDIFKQNRSAAVAEWRQSAA